MKSLFFVCGVYSLAFVFYYADIFYHSRIPPSMFIAFKPCFLKNSVATKLLFPERQ